MQLAKVHHTQLSHCPLQIIPNLLLLYHNPLLSCPNNYPTLLGHLNRDPNITEIHLLGHNLLLGFEN